MKRRTVAQLKKILEESKIKPPRAGVMPTKVVPDKKNSYKRNSKHTKKEL